MKEGRDPPAILFWKKDRTNLNKHLGRLDKSGIKKSVACLIACAVTADKILWPSSVLTTRIRAKSLPGRKRIESRNKRKCSLPCVPDEYHHDKRNRRELSSNSARMRACKESFSGRSPSTPFGSLMMPRGCRCLKTEDSDIVFFRSQAFRFVSVYGGIMEQQLCRRGWFAIWRQCLASGVSFLQSVHGCMMFSTFELCP